jgi:hypothetical protein
MTKNRILIALATTFLATYVSQATELVDHQFGFMVTIPDAFQDFPPGKNRPDVLYSFIRPSANGKKNVNIIIDRMNGTIDHKPMPPEAIEAVRTTFPAESTVGVCRRKWKGYTVEGIEGTLPLGNIKVISRQVQIPLRREAVQLTVAGPNTADQEISEVLDQLLVSLHGESNWDLCSGRKLSTSERIVSGLKALLYLVATIGIAILIAKAVSRRLRQKNKEIMAIKEQPKGEPGNASL